MSVLALLLLSLPSAKPPVLSLVELRVRHEGAEKTVRVAYPKGWTGELEADRRTIRLFGPEGEGEMLVAAVVHPSELSPHLQGLRERHPSSVPSPPSAIDVFGVDPKKGERATRFQITGREVGEMVTIERGGVIVLFATIVAPNAWTEIEKQMARCYPTVDVSAARKAAP